MDTSRFTILVLLYGDRVDLHRRCLDSLAPLRDLVEVRIWCNEITDNSRAYLADSGWQDRVYRDGDNALKYPAMRAMLHELNPVTTEYVMWFDDDSCLTTADPVEWLKFVSIEMHYASMLGSLYSVRLTDNQHLWIQDQPWYNHKPVAPRAKVLFCTGGWWTIHTEILKRHNWPTPDIVHRGGDVMLGELCRQQGYRLQHFRDGVAINADAELRESRSPRRGFDSKPVGWDYKKKAVPYDRHRQLRASRPTELG